MRFRIGVDIAPLDEQQIGSCRVRRLNLGSQAPPCFQRKILVGVEKDYPVRRQLAQREIARLGKILPPFVGNDPRPAGSRDLRRIVLGSGIDDNQFVHRAR